MKDYTGGERKTALYSSSLHITTVVDEDEDNEGDEDDEIFEEEKEKVTVTMYKRVREILGSVPKTGNQKVGDGVRYSVILLIFRIVEMLFYDSS